MTIISTRWTSFFCIFVFSFESLIEMLRSSLCQCATLANTEVHEHILISKRLFSITLSICSCFHMKMQSICLNEMNRLKFLRIFSNDFKQKSNASAPNNNMMDDFMFVAFRAVSAENQLSIECYPTWKLLIIY